MGTVIVDVDVLIDEKFKRMFRGIKLTVDEITKTAKLEKAFERQYPELEAKIPRWTDRQGFTFRCAIDVRCRHKTWKN